VFECVGDLISLRRWNPFHTLFQRVAFLRIVVQHFKSCEISAAGRKDFFATVLRSLRALQPDFREWKFAGQTPPKRCHRHSHLDRRRKIRAAAKTGR